MRIAIYPGSFDPITNGHLDVITRACTLFDRVIIAVAENPQKKPLFSITERLQMLRRLLKDLPKVEVDSYEGLTVEYARKRGACAIIRGLRVISDFEAEFVMALTNKKLAPEIETLFLMTEAQYSFISSSAVKELAFYGGCLKDMVPPEIEAELRAKFPGKKTEIEEG
ncbi:MAG: pantetheine-phosphate adenylyltransferase [Bacillota bacterium]|nr:pantetheine-phosphate adenylyltransferase [Thermoanaerobacteraceae bacterium]